jgi:ATP-dependent Clp protease adaptor protein ClpS
MAESEPKQTTTTESDDASAVATPPEQTGQTQTKRRAALGKTKRLPPFKVILHNDDVNEMTQVVKTIVELTPLATTEAIQRMREADRSGAALLLVTHRERAELYVEQFASCGLTVTAEPDS